MEISPLYEILIFIEDRQSVTTQDLAFLNKNQIRGILGKMEAMKLINKNGLDYSLSSAGQSFLNSILDVLHRPVLHWDGKWRFLSFSIPEKSRSKRDKFRRELEGMGLKPYLNSFWITPLDLNSKIIEKAKELGIYDDILLIESDTLIAKKNENLLSAWDFGSSRASFDTFIREVDNLIANKNRSKTDIKRMIFLYALILNGQPQLPIELLPKDWPEFRSSLQYKRIRRLLN